MPILQGYVVEIHAVVEVKDLNDNIIEKFGLTTQSKASSHGGPRSIMDAVDGGMELLRDRLHTHSEATMVNERERLILGGD